MFTSVRVSRRRALGGLAAIGAGAATSGVLSACGTGTIIGTGPAAAPANSGSGLSVGVIGPFSGEVKTAGESTRNGVLFAIEEARARGITITPVYGDDRNDPTEGSNVATKLIQQDKVKALIGPVSSRVSVPVSEVADSAKILMITPFATNPRVTIDAGKRKPYVFRACFIDTFQGTVTAKFALQYVKAAKAAVLFDRSDDYSVGLSQFFRDEFTRGGGAISVFDSYGRDDVDFSALLTKVAALQPDVLFLPDYYGRVSLIGRQARDRGLSAVLLGGDGWDSADLDRQAVDGAFYSNHYAPDDARPAVQTWVRKYRDRHNSIPDSFATLAYDATNLLVAAIEKAGSSDSAKLREALAGTRGFDAVTGRIAFDADGNPVKSAVVVGVKAGRDAWAATIDP